MMKQNINIAEKQIADFCKRWHITEIALFGSVLRNDLDVLVTFSPEADWSLLEHIQMEQELTDILGRKVELLSKRAVERSHNRMLRLEILNTAEVIYVS